jgi:hypothetical protein
VHDLPHKRGPKYHGQEEETVSSSRHPAPKTPPAILSSEEEWDFLVNQQLYLSGEIRFADQKAGLTLTFSLASLGFLFGRLEFGSLFQNLVTWTWEHPSGMLSVLLLVSSCVLSLLALMPRLWTQEKKGLVFWREVAALGAAEDYIAELRGCNLRDINTALAEQCFSLARICDLKYSLVRFALLTAPIGALIGLMSIVSRGS